MADESIKREKLTTEDQWIILFAFRYALGRQSAAPGIVADYIADNITKFSLFNLQLISNEIQSFLRDPYGYTSDWVMLHKKIQEEIKVRAH